MKADGTLKVLIAALGGQGGGVLTDWIVQAARAQGLVVQATSTPGVSQRTGATTYYLEIAASPADGAAPPVLGLTPMPGRVDLLVCAELLEAARMLERGYCSPARTSVVASTHRVYTTRERVAGGDGRFDSARVVAALRALSRRAVLFDMDAVRLRHRAAISAVLFGALSGSGALGLRRESCEAAIRAAGVGVDQSLAAFDEAFQTAATGGDADAPQVQIAPAETDPATAEAAPRLAPALAARLLALPGAVSDFARPGATQVLAYQDAAYAARYLDRVERIVRAERDPAHPVAREAARWLALWMCYEDLIQVASLKARHSRLVRIRREAGAADGDVVRVLDFFKPRAQEVAAILPMRIGHWLETRAASRAPVTGGKGLTLQSSSVSGALLLRLAGGLRVLRPRSLRFAREQSGIDGWLGALERALAADDRRAVELACLPRLLKGYGDTHAAGSSRFTQGLQAATAALVSPPAGGSGGGGG